jgi:carbonic anhydrase/acetyltransferase-like protein (isoleucine patch superfamily)
MKRPRIHSSAYVAPTATLIGDVDIGEDASIWFGCVLRADEDAITVGPRTNVQDLTVIHADPGLPCRLGSGVTVGHRAVIHGATVEDGAMVGIGAIVLSGATVGEEAIVGAGAVVLEGDSVPPRTLVAGVPAKVVRALDESDLINLREAAELYLEHAQVYRGWEKGDGDG